MFSMLDEESEDDVPVKQTISGKGKQRAGKKGVDVREWENLGCR